MAPEPFLTLPVRSCRDLVHVRQRARQVAELLRFTRHDVMGIAAGAFVVAERAKAVLRQASVCFAVADRQLRVYARPAKPHDFPSELIVLSKALPQDDRQMAVEDITWLIRQVQLLAPTSLRAELARQNLEVLELLTAVRGGARALDPSVDPSAA